jgi:hypothetical protein
MAPRTTKYIAGFALFIAIFALLVGIPALVVSSIAEQDNKDNNGKIDYTKKRLVGHLDTSGNETFTAWVWEDSSGKVNIQYADWNGTCISTGSTQLTSNFTLPDSFMPSYNETTVERCVTPRVLVETTVNGIYVGATGEVCVNADGEIAFYRDISNSTAAWAFASVQCQIKSALLSYLPYKITYD